MRRKRPFLSAERLSVPRRVRADIILRQQGRCPDCGTRLIMGEIVFDHRPPIALREPGDDVNDPDRLAAICSPCDARKTPRDIREIAKTKRLAEAHHQFIARQGEKVPGRSVPSRAEARAVEQALWPRSTSGEPTDR